MAEQQAAHESDLLKAFRLGLEEGNRAWNEGDFARAYGGLPEDFELYLAPSWPQARPLRGPDEIVAFFEDLRETFPDVRTGPPLFAYADEGTAVVGFEVSATGGGSGIPTAWEIWQVWERQGTRLLRVREFLDRRAALEAAGVEQEPGESA